MKKLLVFLILTIVVTGTIFANGVKEPLDSVFANNNLETGDSLFCRDVPNTTEFFAAIVQKTKIEGMEFLVKKIHEKNGKKEFVDMKAQVLLTMEHSFFIEYSLSGATSQYALFMVVPELGRMYYGEGTNVNDFQFIYSDSLDTSGEWKRIPEDHVKSDLGNLLIVFHHQQASFDWMFAARRIDKLADCKVEEF